MTMQVPNDAGFDALYDECVDRLARNEPIDLEALCGKHQVPLASARELLGPLLDGAAVEPDEAKGSDRLGEFKILRELGSGGMGIVYLAMQTSLGRQVALKVIKPIFAQSPQSRARFQREASAVARLTHPNIVAVHTAGEANGTLYLAMDYVEGRGLDELINDAADRDERIPINDSVRYAAQIARALEAAHKEGIVHRDVKPSNVRVTALGKAMLLDFGLARDRESIRLTMSGELQGSPYYMPPELLSGKNVEPDGRCDVYGLGVTLYESLTGRVPFDGETLERVLHQILSDPPPPPRISNAALSKDLETVVLKALEKDPLRRYQTAAEFADDLEAVLTFRPIRAKPPGLVTRAIASARRRPWVVVPLLTLALVAIAYGGIRIRDAAKERERLDSFIAAAEQAIEQKDFDVAANAAASALAMAPDSQAALALRPKLDTARRDFEVNELRAEAAAAAKSHGESLAEWTKLRLELAPLAAARNVSSLSADRSNRLDQGEGELSKIEGALDKLEAVAASAIDRAAALAPKRQDLLPLVADLYAARRESEVNGLRDQAAATATLHAEFLAKWAKLRQDLAPLAAARDVRYLTADQSQRLDRGEIDLSKIEGALDKLEAVATSAIDRAAALAPKRNDLLPLVADLYLTRFIALTESGNAADARRTAASREQIERYDTGKRLEPELLGLGSLAVACEPPGAAVHVFRFVDQSTLGETGERRLVPKPIKELKPPKPFGAWVLAVDEDSAGLRAGDLIVSIAGNAIRNTVLVATGSGEITRCSRLTTIDGRAIRDAIDVDFAEELESKAGDGLHHYEFEYRDAAGAPKKIAIAGKDLAMLRIVVTSPAAIAVLGDVAAEVWSDGVVKKLTLPRGVRAKVTGAPLYACAATVCGNAPLASLALEPGSYIALVRNEGFDDLRLPFVVGRKQSVKLEAKLRKRGSAPDGFRFVPNMNFTTGPDWRTDPPARHEVAIEPFFMMEHEVTFREYLEFLNGANVHVRIANGELPESVLPRISGGAGNGVLVTRNADGIYTIAEGALDLPVHGISFSDAMHYVDWRNATAPQGATVRFDLPKSSEWEFAARGADDRPLVCGDHFVANWLSSALARPRALIEPVMAFPVDESPFGIYDLAGSMNEWCRPDSSDAGDDDVVVRGGAWDSSRPESFRADYFSILPSTSRSATIGFRLVARPL